MSEKLAEEFVEWTTEYDWDELPEHLQRTIIAAADALEEWASAPTIVIKKGSNEPKKVIS